MRHRHDWKIIARTYAGSAFDNGLIKGNNLTEKMLMGVTTILWECQICHQTKKEEMLGKEVKKV